MLLRKPATRERGFTLLELMVVVIVVGLLAALAIPSMRLATYDRHQYQDAGAIMQLFREARLRAVARGSAVLIGMSSSGVGDRGTFKVYEAVAKDPNDTSGRYLMPVPTCKATPWNLSSSNYAPSPTAGATTAVLPLDDVDLNGTPEADADIETKILTYSGGATAGASQTPGAAYVCYTPLGRSYFVAGSGQIGSTPVDFGGQTPSLTVLEVQVRRGDSNQLTGASIRSVIVEPNGMPRILTKVM
jgi:type II secretion system protein H